MLHARCQAMCMSQVAGRIPHTTRRIPHSQRQRASVMDSTSTASDWPRNPLRQTNGNTRGILARCYSPPQLPDELYGHLAAASRRIQPRLPRHGMARTRARPFVPGRHMNQRQSQVPQFHLHLHSHLHSLSPTIITIPYSHQLQRHLLSLPYLGQVRVPQVRMLLQVRHPRLEKLAAPASHVSHQPS
jgi:hypothetical protein